MITNKVFLSSIELSELTAQIESVLDKKLDKVVSAPTSEEYLSRKEAASLLGICVNTLDTYTRSGKIAGFRVGSRVRYKRSVLEQSLSTIKPASL